MAATARQEKEMKAKMEKVKVDPKATPVERLRAYVLAKGVNSLKSLHRVFGRLDEDGNKRVCFEEFRAALRHEGINVSKEMEKACFEAMDTDHSGFLDSEEFIVALRPAMSQHRIDLVNQAFVKLDKTGDGLITIDDLKGIYSAKKHPKYMSGEMTEEDVFREFIKSFNGPGSTSSEVTRDDFTNYYAGVSASIDSDAYFDLMMRQAWKLT